MLNMRMSPKYTWKSREYGLKLSKLTLLSKFRLEEGCFIPYLVFSAFTATVCSTVLAIICTTMLVPAKYPLAMVSGVIGLQLELTNLETLCKVTAHQ